MYKKCRKELSYTLIPSQANLFFCYPSAEFVSFSTKIPIALDRHSELCWILLSQQPKLKYLCTLIERNIVQKMRTKWGGQTEQEKRIWPTETEIQLYIPSYIDSSLTWQLQFTQHQPEGAIAASESASMTAAEQHKTTQKHRLDLTKAANDVVVWSFKLPKYTPIYTVCHYMPTARSVK